MPPNAFTTEQIVNKQLEAKVLVSHTVPMSFREGKTVGEICQSLGISLPTYYRWPPSARMTADCAPIKRSGCSS